jgi:hypothetical protein
LAFLGNVSSVANARFHYYTLIHSGAQTRPAKRYTKKSRPALGSSSLDH